MEEILIKASTAGGAILLSHFQSKLKITNKTGHHNIVTQADTESQQCIKTLLIEEMVQKGIPKEEIGFIGEEDLHVKGSHVFIIDPLDGTSNFATGTEEFCVLIAYFYKEELQAGVMYFPTSNLFYIAEKGKGAYGIKNGKREKLQLKEKNLKDTFIYSSMSYDDDIEHGLHLMLLALKPLFRGVRMIGCAGSEISYMAQNIAGGILLVGCSIWDIAPGKLILSEMGYEMYDLNGKEIVFNLEAPKQHYPFIACDPQHLQSILEALSRFK